VAETVTEQDLQQLEAELKKLEGEYNMFFAGRLARPPWETRSRVEALVTRYDRAHIQNFGHRFRFSTLQSRYAAFVDLWDRGLRAREEGRPGPFAVRTPQPASPLAERTIHVAAFTEPLREMDKLHDLYESLADARRELGFDPVPFHRFVDLVKNQVTAMIAKGNREVAFRVAVRNGKVNLTARGLKDGTA
jgi:hypothetical protein